jgi:multiple sugar transport system ATP-binding protein
MDQWPSHPVGRAISVTDMTTVDLVHLGKTFENGFVAVEDFTLSILDGEVLVLVGPSGCGKSTVLRILAGLEEPTTGEVLIGGRNVLNVPPQHRDIAMVFQSYALYPHMTVRENIGFALQLHRVDKEEINKRVDQIAELLGITPILDRKPKQLSGGQRQRVAMGRAIVRNPQVFLMDEPLSNLDAKLRVHMRSELGRLQQRLGVTTLYVTHDQVEAMTMGDRVAVMDKGRLIQVGTPKDLYDNPKNVFVAAFLGSPAMNLVEGSLEMGASDALELRFGQQVVSIESLDLTRHQELRAHITASEKIIFGIRPEDLEDNRIKNAPRTKTFRALVELVEQLGSEAMVHLVVDDVAALGDSTSTDLSIGETGSRIIGSFDPRSPVIEGETIDVAVDTGRLHYFDQTSGQAL